MLREVVGGYRNIRYPTQVGIVVLPASLYLEFHIWYITFRVLSPKLILYRDQRILVTGYLVGQSGDDGETKTRRHQTIKSFVSGGSVILFILLVMTES